MLAYQDSGAAHPGADSIAVHPSFADPVVATVQFIFQQSPLVMWGGVVLAIGVAAFLMAAAWKRRKAIARGVAGMAPWVKVSVLAGVLVLAAGAAVAGLRARTFVETDNRFCSGCHIFVASGEPWIPSDTGSYTLVNRVEGKHDSLSCHACHALHPVKEAVKMVWWMSGVRDDEIPPHATVPRAVCENCHVRGEAKETWEAIAGTAGHRVHLESDSSALREVECLTCHVQEVHRFVPVNTTCTQQGCHEDTRIVLGDMARRSVSLEAHCTACHDFTAEVPRLATRDSASGTLVPGDRQCMACHPMQTRLTGFQIAGDPHSGTCGMCHDPHAQAEVREAKLTCAGAGCHDSWREEPFHLGANHRAVARQCTLCHQPHQARVDASDCAGCHQQVRDRSGQVRQPPLPFDTTAAKLRAAGKGPAAEPRGKGDVPPVTDPDGGPGPPTPVAVMADTFSHSRHSKLPCLTCHTTRAGQGGKLTFEPPRGCQICHHQAPVRSACALCHQAERLAPGRAMVLGVAVRGHPERPRIVSFQHATHVAVACLECHTRPVSLAPPEEVTTCSSCHQQHHQRDQSCAACHATPQLLPAHRRPVETHQACDACHRPAQIAELVPTRQLCLTCHQPQDHYPPRECTACHFQATPEQFRSRLSTGGRER